MGGNEDGRQNGERLAVDPNDGSILFFGSRRDGLWKSADRGATWARVDSFAVIGATPSPSAFTNGAPARRRGGSQAVGIVSVVFDAASGKRGTPTPVIYAAVSTSSTNLFRSDDAGATWQPVPGEPSGPFGGWFVLFKLRFRRGPERPQRRRGLEIQCKRRSVDGHFSGKEFRPGD
jgi:hypothetical protein